MGVDSKKAVANALQAISKDIEQLKANDVRQDKIMKSQGKEIAQIQKDLMDMRNRAIAAEARSGRPYADIKADYGISSGRISQIKAEYN